MASRPMGVVAPLQRLFAGKGGELSDPQLLERFLTCRDGNAFAALVNRHGPMVLGVCRRLLGAAHDAEDAFQATFLVLVRKASSLDRPEQLASWLYGVAYRTALKARGRNARRRERPLTDAAAASTGAELVWHELRPVLDEELQRLPEKYRVPVVLCYLEGVSKRAAARRLGWPEGTLSTRLHRAREILRGRLSRRGLTLSAGVSTVLFQGTAPAAVPAPLAAVTATAAFLVAAGQPAAGIETAAALAEGVLRVMCWNKRKGGMAALLAFGLLIVGIGGAVLRVPAATQSSEARPGTGRQAARAPKKDAAGPGALRLDKDVKEVVWSPDGKLFASRASRSRKRAGADGEFDWFTTVKVWDAATGKEVASLGELKNAGLIALAFAPDGITLGLSFFRQIQEGSRIELWDARKGALKKTIEMDYGRMVPRFAFAPGGKALAVLYAGDRGRDPKKEDLQGGVRLFDVTTGQVIRSARGHKHMAISLAFSPNGKLLATGGSEHDRDVRLWDVATGKQVRVLDAGASVLAVAFSPDARVLASGQSDGRLVLWSVRTGKELRVLNGSADVIRAVTFSPDGRRLAAAGEKTADGKRTNQTQLWDTHTGELLRSWQDTATSLFFTPDGKALAVLGKDRVMRRWKLRGRRGMPPYGRAGKVGEMSFPSASASVIPEGLNRAALPNRRIAQRWIRLTT